MTRIWLVDADRQVVDLAALCDVDGVATVDVYRIEERPTGAVLRFLWARAGQPVNPSTLAAAQLVAQSAPVPPETESVPTRSSRSPARFSLSDGEPSYPVEDEVWIQVID